MPRGTPGSGRRARGGRRAGRVGGAIAGIRAARDELATQRDALDTQIQALDAALRTVGGGVSTGGGGAGGRGRRGRRGPRPGRGPRAGSLKDHIVKVLNRAGGAMRVKDIATAVVSSGYKSKNKTLAKSVGVALRDLRGVKRVGRGRFRIG